MKTKLETIVNVTVVVMALAVGFVVLRGKIAGPQIPRLIAPGDRLGQVPGIDWSRHRRTLVLALNSGCHFCQDSVPFYEKLAQARHAERDGFAMVAVFPNADGEVYQFAQPERLNIRSVPAVSFEKLRVNATPTLILVNSEGLVEKVWIGILTAKQEMDLLKMAEGT